MNNAEASSTVSLKRINAAIIYRLLLIGLGIPMISFSFVCGVLSLFGFDLVKWNDQPVHGLLAIPAALFSGVFITVLFTVFIGSIACLGLWDYSRFRPLQVKVMD